MTAPNPLISGPPAAPMGFTDMTMTDNRLLIGTGIFGDAATTLDDSAQGTWAEKGIDLAADALDMLALATDPFGVLASTPISWIIEHVGFLKEALDILAGNAEEIASKTATWKNMAHALTESSADYLGSARALESDFIGAAADAYQQAATNYARAVEAAAGHAAHAAQAFQLAGAIVGTVRGLVRDVLAQFAADLVVTGLAAAALAPETFGASLAIWTGDAVLEGASIGERCAADITRAVAKLHSLMAAGQASKTGLDEGAHDLEAAIGATDRGSRNTPARGTRSGDDSTAAVTASDAEPPTPLTDRQASEKYHELATSRSATDGALAAAMQARNAAQTALDNATWSVTWAQSPAAKQAALARFTAAQTEFDHAAANVAAVEAEQARISMEANTILRDHPKARVTEQPLPDYLLGVPGSAKDGYEAGNSEPSDRRAPLDDGSLLGGK